jgi:transcriptional regulator of arginine metabolism
MRPRSGALPKPQRQRLIVSLVSRKRLGSQVELIRALAEEGCAVTQATVSRDLRELGLEKTHDALGRPRYVSPGARRGNPADALRRVLSEFGHQAVAAQNVVVIHSELGSAPAIGRAIDELDHRLVVGTLAGDDTCLVIARNAEDARRIARELTDSIG